MSYGLSCLIILPSLCSHKNKFREKVLPKTFFDVCHFYANILYVRTEWSMSHNNYQKYFFFISIPDGEE